VPPQLAAGSLAVACHTGHRKLGPVPHDCTAHNECVLPSVNTSPHTISPARSWSNCWVKALARFPKQIPQQDKPKHNSLPPSFKGMLHGQFPMEH
jgi:hypothetical protein